MIADELFADGLGLAGKSVLSLGQAAGIGDAIAVGLAALGSQDRDGAERSKEMVELSLPA